MRLSDLIGSFNISTYPQVALVIFLIVFGAVCARLLRAGVKESCAQAGMIPLLDDEVTKTKEATP